MAEQFVLGQKYLPEQIYEQANIVFDKIIELESKYWETYKGIAEAYRQ